MLGLIISAIVVGLIIGALGRLVLPGRQDTPIWLTILIGMSPTMMALMISPSTLSQDSGPRWCPRAAGVERSSPP